MDVNGLGNENIRQFIIADKEGWKLFFEHLMLVGRRRRFRHVSFLLLLDCGIFLYSRPKCNVFILLSLSSSPDNFFSSDGLLFEFYCLPILRISPRPYKDFLLSAILGLCQSVLRAHLLGGKCGLWFWAKSVCCACIEHWKTGLTSIYFSFMQWVQHSFVTTVARLLKWLDPS